MNVDVAQSGDTVAEKRLQPLASFQPSENRELIVGVAFGIVGVIILIFVLICLFVSDGLSTNAINFNQCQSCAEPFGNDPGRKTTTDKSDSL
ncbi:hypothetical protein HUJ05_012955 [Dendroctonus ponderosae]|nr:hypothetical protein HUJ05_012955 [Dendroctonus ponderosae]